MIGILKKMMVRQGLFIWNSVVSNIELAKYISLIRYIDMVAPLPTKLVLFSPDTFCLQSLIVIS